MSFDSSSHVAIGCGIPLVSCLFTYLFNLYLVFIFLIPTGGYVYWFKRGREGGREKERSIDVWEKHQSVASHTCPNQELNPQPRYVPLLGIKPITFWCMVYGLILFLITVFFFCCCDWVFSTILSSKSLIPSSVSSDVLLISYSVFFISVIVFLISDWSFFLFSISILCFLSLCWSSHWVELFFPCIHWTSL